MKKYVIIISCFLFLLTLAAGESRAAWPFSVKIGKGDAQVSFLSGTAQVLPAGKKDWKKIKVKDVLRNGDEVKTGAKTKMEVSLPDKSRLRFADNSHFKIVQMETAASKPVSMKINMKVGRGWASVSKALGGQKKNFELTCENAVAGVRGTIYRMNVNTDQSAIVKVYDGNVAVTGGGKEVLQQPQVVSGAPQKIDGPTTISGPTKVTMEEWTVIIKAMQQITIGSDGRAGQPQDFNEAEDRDEWVDWNKSRDREITTF